MPQYVCVTKGVKYNHKVLDYGEVIIANSLPSTHFRPIETVPKKVNDYRKEKGLSAIGIDKPKKRKVKK